MFCSLFRRRPPVKQCPPRPVVPEAPGRGIAPRVISAEAVKRNPSPVRSLLPLISRGADALRRSPASAMSAASSVLVVPFRPCLFAACSRWGRLRLPQLRSVGRWRPCASVSRLGVTIVAHPAKATRSRTASFRWEVAWEADSSGVFARSTGVHALSPAGAVCEAGRRSTPVSGAGGLEVSCEDRHVSLAGRQGRTDGAAGSRWVGGLAVGRPAGRVRRSVDGFGRWRRGL